MTANPQRATPSHNSREGKQVPENRAREVPEPTYGPPTRWWSCCNHENNGTVLRPLVLFSITGSGSAQAQVAERPIALPPDKKGSTAMPLVPPDFRKRN